MVDKIKAYAGWAGLFGIFLALTVFMINTTWGIVSTIFLVAGLLLIALWVVTHLDTVKRIYHLRQTKYGTNMVVVIITMIAILGIINYLGAVHHRRLDTTSGGQFSLSEQTIKILKGLTDEVKVTVFEKETSENRQKLEDLLSIYSYFSNKFKVKFVDPDKNPGITKNYGVTTYGTIVLEHGDRMEKITESTEEDITNALIKVLKEKKQVLYFVVGHAEKDIEETKPNGYSKAEQALTDENYDVKTLNLLTDEKVPDDCAVLIIAGPTKSYQSFELKAITDYLNHGGRLQGRLDPREVERESQRQRGGGRLGDGPVVPGR